MTDGSGHRQGGREGRGDGESDGGRPPVPSPDLSGEDIVAEGPGAPGGGSGSSPGGAHPPGPQGTRIAGGPYRAEGRPEGRLPSPRLRRPLPAVIAVVYGAAAALTAAAIGWTLWDGPAEPGTALAFGALIALGEAARIPLPGDREAAPLATAGALAYALLGPAGGRPTTHGVLQVVAVVVVAALIGLLPHAARGSRVRGPMPGRAVVPARRADPPGGDSGDSGGIDGSDVGSGGRGKPPIPAVTMTARRAALEGIDGRALDTAARRVLTVGFAATSFQPLYNSGLLDRFLLPGALYALFLLILLALTALCDAVLAAALSAARSGRPFAPALRDEVRALPGIGSAICAGGVVLAIAVGVAGLWALPVFSLPLLLTQVSFRRHAAIRATCRQTIASLARATEVAGYTPVGHARRVSSLCGAVGRELGMSERDLLLLEYAALMHDIGQLSLVDPVPGGATEPLEPAARRRIALLGGEVVRQTGVPAEVAVIVECQADPYLEQPLAGRIVRTVNAYEDLTGESAALERRLAAVERLRLATAYDYDPRVVEALTRVLSRGEPGGNERRS